MEVKSSLGKVVLVRLSSDRWEVLRKEAAELEIGPSMLVRMWILEMLRSLKTQEEALQVAARVTQVKTSTMPSAMAPTSHEGGVLSLPSGTHGKVS